MITVKFKNATQANAKSKHQSQRRRRSSLGPAELIKSQRKLLGLTREQLAKRAGVPLNTIKKAETGPIGSVPWNELYAIGVALGVSIGSASRAAKLPVNMEEILRSSIN